MLTLVIMFFIPSRTAAPAPGGGEELHCPGAGVQSWHVSSPALHGCVQCVCVQMWPMKQSSVGML